MVRQERVVREKENNPNLLYCDRIGSAAQALIGMGLVEESGLMVEEKRSKTKVGNRSFLQHSTEVIIFLPSGVEFTRAVKFEYIHPRSSRFKKGERIIVNGCLLQGVDEEGKVVSVGFTMYVLGATGEYAGILYTLQRERRKPIQWAEGTPSPLSIIEQQRVAKAVGLPTF